MNVNYAAEKLSFEITSGEINLEKIEKTVEDSGYKLIIPAASDSDNSVQVKDHKSKYYFELRFHFITALILTLPIFRHQHVPGF